MYGNQKSCFSVQKKRMMLTNLLQRKPCLTRLRMILKCPKNRFQLTKAWKLHCILNISVISWFVCVQEEYLDALNRQEIAKKELEGAQSMFKTVQEDLQRLRQDAESINKLYKEQDELLGAWRHTKFRIPDCELECEFFLFQPPSLMVRTEVRLSSKWSLIWMSHSTRNREFRYLT